MKKIIGPGLIFALPVLAYATTFDDIIGKFQHWLALLLPIAIGVALVVFIWGMVVFIAKSGDETERVQGRQRMIWGIIALFVIISIWGLVNFIGDSLVIHGGAAPPAPGLPSPGGGGGGGGGVPPSWNI